jgi:pilus assembly protein Flp/PilA
VLRKRVLEIDVNTLLRPAISLWHDQSGATAIEYGLLTALIAVVIIGTVASVGQSLEALYPRLESYLSADGTP